jgi:hypothetical protein
MHCCKKILSGLLSCALLVCLSCKAAQAEGISVNKVEVRFGENGYQLSAGYDITLNSVVQDALTRGIPLYFVAEFSLTRARWDWLDNAQQAVSRSVQSYFVDEPTTTHWSWLDANIFEGEQTIKLSYNVLTRRYRISRGALFQNFNTIDEALNILGSQSSETIPADLLDKNGKYMVAARLLLDITQLPKPLQVNALTGNDWTLDSAWYRWSINTAEINTHNQGPAE